MLLLFLLAGVVAAAQAQTCPIWGYSDLMSVVPEELFIPPNRAGKFKIWNGMDADRGAWPWMASLRQRQTGGEFRHICGATLVHPRWLLTAAHCFPERDQNHLNYRIILGDHDRTVVDKDEEVYGVENFLLFPLFLRHGFAGRDIAVIRLDRDVQISERIKPILLPEEELEESRENSGECYVLGWGKTESGKEAKTLQQLEVKIRTGPECWQIHREQELIGTKFNPKRLFCPEFFQEEQGSCQGDSGGPLICMTRTKQFIRNCATDNMINGDVDEQCAECEDKDDEEECSVEGGSCKRIWRLIGIVSKGIDCGQRPGVYPNIQKYRFWLRNNTDINY